MCGTVTPLYQLRLQFIVITKDLLFQNYLNAIDKAGLWWGCLVSGSRTVPACPPIPGTGWLADYYSILLLGCLVEELSGERFSYCPGLPAYTGDRMAC